MANTFDEMIEMAERAERRPVEYVPDPPRRDRKYLLFSVDDHVCEAADTFTARVPERLRGVVPRIVLGDTGDEAWLVEGQLRRWTGGDSIVGRRIDGMADLMRTLRYADMRPGSYDIHARIKDMDLDGVYASMPFPSMVWGFCGQKIWGHKDGEVGLACVRAYNDWMFEEWSGPYPQRIIPASVPFLRDPVIAAEEVHRNAGRGFKAVHFSENPEKLGLPSIHTRHWDPFFQACQETDTTVNLHLGSSSTRPNLSSDTPVEVTSLLWPAQTMSMTADWVHSKIAVRFPRIKFAMSEGGVGWVSILRERMERAHRMRAEIATWGEKIAPVEVLLRNFWFCAIEEPRSMTHLDDIGTDRVMLEVDYPHADGSWPDTQARVDEMLRHLPNEAIRKITHETAAYVYRHPIPSDPEWSR